MIKGLEISQLQRLQELETLHDNLRNAVDILLSAINDWPDTIIKLEDYELAVHNFIGSETTKSKIELFLSQIDYSKDAWRGESLGELVKVFQFYNGKASLKEIIEDLRIECEAI
ncbi:MAG: hypothetical protein ACTHLE_15425 [Agriterribacter sp.]